MDRRRTRSDEVPTPTIDTDDNEDGSGEDMDEEADSYEDQCHMCKGGGEVVCCDYCPKAYHLACVNLKYPPDGHARFACPPCGDDVCDTCERKGKHATVRCRYCCRRYHPDCLDRLPAPEDLWLCPACEQEASVEKILSWRPRVQLTPTEVARRVDAWHRETKQRGPGGPKKADTGLVDLTTDKQEVEYHVRWSGRAYWHCSWVSESFLAQHAKVRLKNFKARQADLEMEIGEEAEEDDEGPVHPNWLQADRILDARRTRSIDGQTRVAEYFVKWMGLEYDESTWELKSDLVRRGFEPLIKHFHRRDHEWTKGLQGNLGLPSSMGKRFHPLVKQPSGLFQCGQWHDYQLDGINFLRNAWYAENHVILADEMGLGKTIQTIGYLRCIAIENTGKFLPSLVVCPLAVVDNWERELHTWCPELDVVVYKGSQASRDLIQKYEARGATSASARGNKQPRKKKKTGASASGVVRTRKRATAPSSDEEDEEEDDEDEEQDSADAQEAAGLKRRRCGNSEGKAHFNLRFHVLITSFDFAARDASFLHKIKWESVVVDEGHRLKGGAVGRLYRTLQDFTANHRVLLTGTPLQNSLDELFNLLHFLEPEKFQDVEEFRSEFASMDKEAQLAKLRDLIAPHMLRRLKKDVNLCIPEKHELLVRVELSDLQKDYYRLYLTQNFELLRKKFKAASSIYNMIMQLKKVCNHPWLTQEPEDDDTSATARGEALIAASGKLKLLDVMLNKLKRDGHRVLLFSQMTSMLDLLEEYVSFRQWRYQRIDGGTKAMDRQARIDAFNGNGNHASQGFIFLLSTRAGGLGINLTSADTVIIYDMDWNPHNDLQALARAHRIGQTRKVMIYRFVARNSVEERILQLAKKKLLLEHVVVGEAGRGRNLSQVELDDVLKYGTEELFTHTDDPHDNAQDDEEEEVQQGAKGKRKRGSAQGAKGGLGKKGGMGARRVIHWDDAAIERLLDRDAVAQEDEDKGNGPKGGSNGSGLSELFNSFRVARFSSIEEAPAEEGEGKVEEVMPPATDKTWSDLLGTRYEALVGEEEGRMGKGKRERREVARHSAMVDSLLALGPESEGSGEEEDSGEEGDNDSRVRGHGPRGKPEALLEKYRGGKVSVYGMNEGQRRCVRAFLMSFGLMGGDWKAFYAKLMKVGARRLGDRSLAEVRRYVSLVLTHAQELAADPSLTHLSGGVPREQLDPGLLKRLALLDLIRAKVNAYATRRPADFTIYENGVTAWGKAMPLNTVTQGVGWKWSREMDLPLLRMTVKHGYGNWRRMLTDPEFAPVRAKALTLTTKEKDKEKEQGAHKREEGSAVEDEEDEEGEGGGGGAETGLTEPQTRAVLILLSKRVKLLGLALCVEKQLAATRAKQGQALRDELTRQLAVERNAPPLPPDVAELEARREALKGQLDALFERLCGEARVDDKRTLLGLVERRDDQQVLLADLLGRIGKLAQGINASRGLLVLGSMAAPRLQALLDDMDGVKEQLRQALGSASGMSDQVEAAIQQLYPHATQDQGNT